MDSSFYGRCHPDNIWALTGLAGCLRARIEASSAGRYQYGASCCSSVTADDSQGLAVAGSDAERITQWELELTAVYGKLSTLFPGADASSRMAACLCAQAVETERCEGSAT
jgi:hypothetical protein